MTTRRPSISVVYPMFNEEENIERAVHFAEVVLADMTSDYEILIVNDASTDQSAEIAEALAGLFEADEKVVRFPDRKPTK